MSITIAEMFRAERQRQDLSVKDVARLAGWHEIGKGARRIEKVEQDGSGNPEFLERIFWALGLSVWEAEQEVQRRLRRHHEERLAAWLATHSDEAAFAVKLIVRRFAWMYGTNPMPADVRTARAAFLFAADFSKRHGLKFCLPLAPQVLVYFDSAGGVESFQEQGDMVVPTMFTR
jgi:transcriptional regulator with XRE-family HTH domain